MKLREVRKEKCLLSEHSVFTEIGKRGKRTARERRKRKGDCMTRGQSRHVGLHHSIFFFFYYKFCSP